MVENNSRNENQPIENIFSIAKEVLNSNDLDFVRIDPNLSLTNKVYEIKGNGQKYILKHYFRDIWNRFDHEIAALEFFNVNPIIQVPKLIYKNKSQNFAILSFIEGKKLEVKKIDKKIIELIFQVAKTLNSVEIQAHDRAFNNSGRACLSFSDYFKNINDKYETFNGYFQTLEDKSPINQLISSRNIVKKFSKIKSSLEKKYSKTPNENVETKNLSFNHCGFHISNMILKNSGKKQEIALIDFENSGWDDPQRMVADFVAFPENDSLNDKLKAYFKDLCMETFCQTEIEREIFLAKIEIMTAEYITTYLYSIVPEIMERRKFARRSFNEHEYVKDQIDKATGLTDKLYSIYS